MMLILKIQGNYLFFRFSIIPVLSELVFVSFILLFTANSLVGFSVVQFFRNTIDAGKTKKVKRKGIPEVDDLLFD